MQLLGLFLVLAVTIGDGKVMDSNALQDQVPPLQRHVANLFASFCEMYGKHYLGEEKSRRLRTFEESMVFALCYPKGSRGRIKRKLW